jgi:23S rRNA pseudouridine1911/1915/1917 synthase
MFARRIDKDYLAVVWGRVSPPRGTIDLALDRDPWDRRRVMVTDRGGQPSRTQYERLARSRGPRRGLALLRCRLLTGRMHQIRVHLAAKGWPIVGDPAYGGAPEERLADAALDAAARGFGRQALHAWRLALAHPVTGAALVVESPVPGDMRALLAAAGLSPPSGASPTAAR